MKGNPFFNASRPQLSPVSVPCFQRIDPSIGETRIRARLERLARCERSELRAAKSCRNAILEVGLQPLGPPCGVDRFNRIRGIQTPGAKAQFPSALYGTTEARALIRSWSSEAFSTASYLSPKAAKQNSFSQCGRTI